MKFSVLLTHALIADKVINSIVPLKVFICRKVLSRARNVCASTNVAVEMISLKMRPKCSVIVISYIAKTAIWMAVKPNGRIANIAVVCQSLL